MKPPPFLLGAVLLFWGWQSEFLLVGAAMAVALESAHFIKARWEFSDEDFNRTWTFCALLFLVAGIYAFTSNEGPATFGNLFQRPNLFTQRNAGVASARTASAMIRWLPMLFLPFVAAQIFSTRGEVPLAALSFIVRRRQRRAKKAGLPPPPSRYVNVAFPYLGLCLLAGSVHPPQNDFYFWGLCLLLAWALWSQRSVRFAVPVWAGALAVAIVLGYAGQRGVGQLQRYLENLNASWLARLARRGGTDPSQSRTALGRIGELKLSGKIVIRLEPKHGQPPTLLREATYRRYQHPVWSASLGRENFQTTSPETNGTTFVLLPEKSNTASATISCYLSERSRQTGNPKDLLPLPEGSGRLENLPAYLLQTNLLGAVLAEGPGLVIFDALFGPGATLDSPPTDEDRGAWPTKEIPALEKIVAELNVPGATAEQKLQAVRKFFETKFTYSTYQPRPQPGETNETALSRFLLERRSGHCEYFATATVLLLRKLDIPARYAVGYAVHESSGKKYIVRLRDAHSWCLVWNEARQVWEDFDTTPASWMEVEGKRASPFQALSDAWSWIGFQISKVRWGQTRLREYILWSLIPVLGLLLYQIIFRRGRRKHGGKKGEAEMLAAWPGLDSEFYQLEKQLAERGFTRRTSEPLNEWLGRVVEVPNLAPLRAPMQELLQLHYRHRFDPLGLGQTQREALKRQAAVCMEGLSGAGTLSAKRQV